MQSEQHEWQVFAHDSKLCNEIKQILTDNPYESYVDMEEEGIEIVKYVRSDGSKYVELDSRIHEQSLLGKSMNGIPLVGKIFDSEVKSLPYYARVVLRETSYIRIFDRTQIKVFYVLVQMESQKNRRCIRSFKKSFTDSTETW